MTNSHKGFRFLRLHTIAKLGYVVVVMDCRGSGHRGLQFEGHIKSRLVSEMIGSCNTNVLNCFFVSSQASYLTIFYYSSSLNGL